MKFVIPLYDLQLYQNKKHGIETRSSIITIVDMYVVVEIQIQATNNVTMCNVNHE
jgi:hypothetical protein